MKISRIHFCYLLPIGLLLAGGCNSGPATPAPGSHHYTPEEIRALYMKRVQPGGPGAKPPAGTKTKPASPSP